MSESIDEIEDDQFLLNKFVEQNDEVAFKQLVIRYQRTLYEFVWRKIGDHDDTTDLCQNTFVQVFLKAHQFRNESTFKTWMYKIAINLILNHWRSKKRERIDDIELEQLKSVDENSVDDNILNTQERRFLQRKIKTLPDKQRTTLELRIYQDLNFLQISEVMNCTVGTAKANFHHGTITLRKNMTECKL